MPYMVISGFVDNETTVGNKNSDPDLMACLGAKKGTLTKNYCTSLTPPEVMNRLEARGWKVVTMCKGLGGELVWTLHNEGSFSKI